ncbi:MAG: ATP-binding protein [Pauljensenia sp.]
MGTSEATLFDIDAGPGAGTAAVGSADVGGRAGGGAEAAEGAGARGGGRGGGRGAPGEGTAARGVGAGGIDAAGQWRLARLQVLDWGTFSGHHDLPVPRRGLLLTGESGSGKSSLLDAISAVMVPPAEAHFNAAATDAVGGDRDRTPMSYVRGAHRRLTDAETQEIHTAYLREGPTCSAIAMTWEDGRGGVASAVRVFHVRGRSLQAQDLRTAFVLLDGEVDLAAWRPVIAGGIDQRRLRATFPGAVVEQTYRGFGPRLRRRLGIGSTTALKLLHRAMSAKSLRSLDALLRDFMLDEPSTFGLADTAVEQFVELRTAHETVLDARDQVDVLAPLRQTWQARTRALERRDAAEKGLAHLPVLQAVVTERDASRELDEVLAQQRRISALQEDQEAGARAIDQELEAGRSSLFEQGGGEIERAHSDVRTQQEHLAEVEEARGVFQALLDRLDAQSPGSREEHALVVDLARRERAELGDVRDSGRFDDPMGRRIAARTEGTRLEEEIRSLSRRRTRIPAALAGVRDALASEIGVPPGGLPFAGELADVSDRSWAGALERLMGGFARTLVVPEELFAPVASWVDRHHLGLRLAFERADLTGGEVARTDVGSAARKLTVAPGRFEYWMLRQLARRFPHVCVEDASDLGDHERALTRHGLVRDRRRHVKDDRFRIEDESRWVIGTDNALLVDQLRAELERVRERGATAQREIDAIDAETVARQDRILTLDQVARTSWDGIDVEGAARGLDRAREHLDLVMRSHADLEPLRLEVARLEEVRAALVRDGQDLATQQGALQNRRAACEAAIAEARVTLDAVERDPDLEADLEARVRAHARTVNRERIATLVEVVRQELQTEVRSSQGQVTAAENVIQRAQVAYTQRWPGHSADLVVEVTGTPDFLAVLDRLQTDRLPEFEERFRRLLSEQSQQNLAALNWQIGRASEEVVKRIAPVNESLTQTPFDRERGRFLRLEARSVHSGEVRDFVDALRSVTEGAFNSSTETEVHAEERFARMDDLLERLGSTLPTDRQWRARVLDTRLHMTFIAVERDAEGNQTDVYQGSGGRSGGQGQKLVTFCLAAALRYQLADAGSLVPRYGTVALDEAFDKTDVNFTRAGLGVFRTFQFQLLLATPLKMLQTIEHYVGGAAMVSNVSGAASTLSSIRFEELEEAGAGGSDGESGQPAGHGAAGHPRSAVGGPDPGREGGAGGAAAAAEPDPSPGDGGADGGADAHS